MKQRLNKLLAIVLTASLCVPMLPTGTVRAANAGSVYFTDAEKVSVTTISGERFSNFNEGWKFNLGESSTAQNKEFNDSSWSEVTLPHDFSIIQEFTTSGEAESGFLPGGTGWYRKTFTVPKSLDGKTMVLNFDGVYSHAYVYVNGEKVGENHYGYTSFAFDVTDYLTCDGETENVIAVQAVNNIPSSRWYSGSGIYRDVTMIVTDPVHVALNGTYVTTPNLATSDGSDGTVNVTVEVQNDSDAAANITVRNSIYEKGGADVMASAEATTTVAAGETVEVESSPTVSNPKLWSLDEPNLYYVRTEILTDGKVVDTYDTEFGFKWYAFVDNVGFQLNGENVKINGVSMHHDQGALGSAAYSDAIYRQLSILKDMGVNTIRATHNPYDEDFVNICNELGILVIEEAFDGWSCAKNGNTNDFSTHFKQNLAEDNQIIGGDASMTWAEFAIKAMVKRDRNDASIILWSLGNEITEGVYSGSTADYGTISEDLIRWVQEVDTTHPVTSGDNRRSTSGVTGQVGQNIYNAGGVVGFNYGQIAEIDDLHETYPVLLYSETASAITSRGIYMGQSGDSVDGKMHLTSYDTYTVSWGKTAHESMWNVLTRDYIAGECVWTGFDYIGEPTPYNGIGVGSVSGKGAVPNSSYFGIVDTAGFPKDNYYLYRSQWNQNENTLHLVTAWDSDNMMTTDGKTPVWVYSNAAKVELYRDDTLIGTATRTVNTTDAGHVYYTYATVSNDESICTTTSGTDSTSLYSVFNVAFTEGTISAKAYDETGKDITDTCGGTSSVSTPGAVSKLEVSQNVTEIPADGSSLAYISVDVTDAAGNLDTTAVNEITFSVEGNGEIMGVDNGDPATTEKFQQPSVLLSDTSAKINAYAGKALVIVRSTTDEGGFTVTASSNGLTGATVSVNTTAVTSGGEKQMASYKLSKHCYVPTGSSDIALPSTVEATYTDGSVQNVPIVWEAYDKAALAQDGSFQIDGSISDGSQTVKLYITVHVYDPIGGVQGYSVYTQPNVVPALPTSAMVYHTDGTEFEEYPVTWDMSGVTAASLATEGTVVTVNGTVSVLDKTYPTTATIRVAAGVLDAQANVAPSKLHLIQDRNDYSDSLAAIVDENRVDTGASGSRWSTWALKDDSSYTEDAVITMDWATAVTTDQINLFFFYEPDASEQSKLPTSVKFEYALSASWDDAAQTITADWIEVGYADPESITLENDSVGKTVGYSYKLNESITPVAIRISLGHETGSYIGLNEVEIMSPTYSYHPNTSATLGGATVGGTTVDFTDGQEEYTVNAGFIDEIVFDNPENAALTFIQESTSAVKVVAVSEDGSARKVYTLNLTNVPTAESKQALQSKLDEYKAIDSTLYTAESYAALQKLIAEMEAAIDKTSESQLKANLAAIVAAYGKLVKAEPATTTPPTNTTPTTPVNPSPSPSPSIKAGDTVTLKNIQYKVVDASAKTVAVAKGTNKKATKVTIPATVKVNGVSCKVVQISANAFKGYTKLKAVVIGKNVKTIAKKAFYGCTKLSKVTFKGTAVKTIKSGAFKKTSSKMTVKVPKALKKNKKTLTAFKKKLTKGGMSKKLTVK